MLTRTELALYDDSGGRRLLRRGHFVAATLGPRAQAVVAIRTEGATDVVDVFSRTGTRRRVFAGAGSFDGIAWSPDGRWLLVTWKDADQWVFVRVRGGHRIKAVAGVSRQFEARAFPRLAGWVPDAP